MQIVTDHGADLTPEQKTGLDINYVPLRITLEGRTYEGGKDLSADEFYEMLSKTEEYPTTSQPSAGEFADLYRKLAVTDPDILSIHISSGLSGTVSAATAGAAMVPEARVTIVDTKTLSCPQGWQVEAAARAVKNGWPLEKILSHLERIGEKAIGVFTLNSLKYLIHGGRISHLKGLVASLLNIKPIISVDRETGKYRTDGQEVTLKRAMNRILDFIESVYPAGSQLRIQPLHGKNPDAVEFLVDQVQSRFKCHLEPVTPVAPVLGAHTGPSLVGLAFAPMDIFSA